MISVPPEKSSGIPQETNSTLANANEVYSGKSSASNEDRQTPPSEIPKGDVDGI